MTNCRPARLTSRRPSGAVRAANSPITNEPTTFTKLVAHKALSPIPETIRTPDRNRSSDPIAAPHPTARQSLNAALLSSRITASHQKPDGGGESCPDCRDAKTCRKDSVQCCLQPFTIEREIERLQTEGRNRRIAPEKSDEGKVTKRLSGKYSATRSCQSGENADGESTRYVDDEGAPRKGLTDPPADKARDEKAEDAAEEASEQDEGAAFESHGNGSPHLFKEDSSGQAHSPR